MPVDFPRRWSALVITLTGALLAAPLPADPLTPENAPQTPGHHRLEVDVPAAAIVRRPFLLSLPDRYPAPPGTRWPVVIFLHGAGEKGTDLQAIFAHGPAAEWTRNPEVHSTAEYIVLSPQLPWDRDWSHPDAIRQVVATLDAVVRAYPIDEDRVSITGLSMGGTGVWHVASAAADRLAVAVPICGRALEPDRTAARLRETAAWIIVGEYDGDFTTGSQQMHQAIGRVGGRSDLSVVPGEGHGVWGRVYPDPAFYRRLLGYRRSASAQLRDLLARRDAALQRLRLGVEPSPSLAAAAEAASGAQRARRLDEAGRAIDAYRTWRTAAARLTTAGDPRLQRIADEARRALKRYESDPALMESVRRADSAEAGQRILEIADRLRLEGATQLAQQHYREIIAQHPATPAAVRASASLGEIDRLGW